VRRGRSMPARAHVKRCKGAAIAPQRLWHRRNVNNTRYVRLVNTVRSKRGHDQRPWIRYVSALRLVSSTLAGPYRQSRFWSAARGGGVAAGARWVWHMSLTSYTWRTFTVGAIVLASFGKPAEMRGRKASGPEGADTTDSGVAGAHRAAVTPIRQPYPPTKASRIDFRVAESAFRAGSLGDSRHGIVRCQAVGG
jgi:hypothetical protein